MQWYRRAKSSIPDIMDGFAEEKGFTKKDADPNQLEKGIKIELEHTKSKELAAHIALDHLAEFPDYYDRLEKMESEAKKDKKG